MMRRVISTGVLCDASTSFSEPETEWPNAEVYYFLRITADRPRTISTDSIVCEGITVMPIFVGVRSNESGVVKNCHFAFCGLF